MRLFHRNEKTIPDIYDRGSMALYLLITICGALKKDFLKEYYTEEPLKSLRNDEIAQLTDQIQKTSNQLQKLTDENKFLHRELALRDELNKAQQEIISFLKGQVEHYKSHLDSQLDQAKQKSMAV